MAVQINIDNLAMLSRLRLTDSEKERLGGHLETIIRYIDKLNGLDTNHVDPTSHVLPLQNVFHEDLLKKTLPDEDFLRLAPSNKKGHYEVPKVL